MFKEWREQRKARKVIEAYRNGFGWAMEAFYIDHYSLEYIVNKCTGNPADEAIHLMSFDSGARHAVTIINKSLEK